MKVNPRYIKSSLKKGIFQTLFILTTISINSCDFDVPDEFVMPIWDIELKIPLVQTKYEMSFFLGKTFHPKTNF